jgi:hypothetical protein
MAVSGLSYEQLVADFEARASADAPLERLAAAAATARELRELGDELLDRYVSEARRHGCSWTEVGGALGVSKQAAQQRFVSPHPDAGAWPKDFSAGARALITAAAGEARRFRHRYLGSEHLLVALTADDGLAGATLARVGVTGDRVRERISAQIGEGHSGPSATLGMAPEAKRALEAARKEAVRLGHRCPEPEDLLLALSASPNTPAAQILSHLGASEQRIRAELSELLAGEAPELAAKLRAAPRRRLGRRPLNRSGARRQG